MKIVTLEKEEFDKLAKNSKYESYFQTSSYAELEMKNGFNVHYLGFVDDNDDLIGGAMCLYRNLFWNYSYAYVPRGLLIDYDNPYLVNQITAKLKKLLFKQNFVFVRIDPPVVASERDPSGKMLYFSSTVNEIINTLEKNGYKHFGYNNYYETRLPRWNLIIKLNKDAKTMYNSFDSEVKENIQMCHHSSVEIIEDKTGNINDFYEFIKSSYGRVGKKYFENLYNCFKKNDEIDIFYAKINSSKYVENANKHYSMEEEKNLSLASIISGNDTHKYNIPKVISDKMESDKKLHQYKKDIVASTEFLKKFPDGKTVAASLVIKHQKGADCLVLYEDKNYQSYKPNSLLIYEMCKKYGHMDLKYLMLGPACGNFDKRNPHYRKMVNKLGFNTAILEYIGQFDLIINPFMYKIYQQKNHKK